MSFKLPPANTLRFFEAAARLRSFKYAADEVHVTPSAISHGISTLEAWLGVELFHRNGRGLTLSEAGESYLPDVRKALAMLATATERLPGRNSPGRVTVATSAEFAATWLVGRISDFVQIHPKVQIKIETDTGRTLSAQGPDFSIRRSAASNIPSFWIKLSDDTSAPVCSPAYRASLGSGDDVTLLRRANLIRLPSDEDEWDIWFAASGIRGPMRLSGLQVDTIQLALQAVLRGLGVALCPTILTDHDRNRGHLVEIGDQTVLGKGSYWLVENSPPRTETGLFRDWLVRQFVQPEPSKRSACLLTG